MTILNRILFFLWLPALINCGGQTTQRNAEASAVPAAASVPVFHADSAYAYIATQVAFGARVPGTVASKACAAYLADELLRHGARVIKQQAQVIAYDGTELPITNLIASFNPDAPARILLCAHWDTRPWADQDPNKANHHTPILGANDGASGAGVLLEIARIIGQNSINIGLDLILFDAEDYGVPHWDTEAQQRENTDITWCLGSQYWAANPHVEGYTARYGVLLDMVGAGNTVFFKEGYSLEYAAPIVERVWSMAAQAGYGDMFQDRRGGYITDDHLPVNQRAGIPCIDIIGSERTGSSFPTVWHTLKDDMTCIDRSTLQAVGQTLLTLIYNETE
jgi:hypothetical protein